MESRSYPITLKTIVLSARGGPFWATPDPVPLMLFHEGFPFPSPGCVMLVTTRTRLTSKRYCLRSIRHEMAYFPFLKCFPLQRVVIFKWKTTRVVLLYHF